MIKIKKLLLILIGVAVFVPAAALAHQPRIVTTTPVVVTDPATSKAYYATLNNKPDVYTIHASEPFDLYVNVLVPDLEGQKKDVSALVTKNGVTIASLDGSTFEWKTMWEEFGQDTYWQGPEYKAHVDAGDYEVRVSSPNNDSKYSLAIGEIENFNFSEIVNALTLVPQIKRDFFNESPIGFFLSPFGWSFILMMFVVAFIVGFAYRFILKRVAKKGSARGVSKNIGVADRLLRIAIGILLLILAITTTWSPLLIFFSGFAIFEGVFSWCGFYAAIGRSTCPINP